MTVMVTDSSKRFHGAGSSGPFTWTWRFLRNADIEVYRILEPNEDEPSREVLSLLVEGADYTLTGAGSYQGGSLTLSSVLVGGTDLLIQRVTKATQEVSIRNQGNNFRPATHEDVFDRLTMVAQDQVRRIEAAEEGVSLALNVVDSIAAAEAQARAAGDASEAAERGLADTLLANMIAALSAGLPSDALTNFTITPMVVDIITKTDLRFFMDGQAGRPTLLQWTADQANVDLTAVLQACADYNHGRTGLVNLPAGKIRLTSTAFLQTDTTTGGTGKIWKPLHIQGRGTFKPNGVGAGGDGATIIYKANAGVMLSVNLASTTGANMAATDAGLGNTATGASMTHQFFNFSMSDIAFMGVNGVQVTPLKGYSTRARLKRLSFISVWRGFDFHDLDSNGANNYCDMWTTEDLYMSQIGDHGFKISGCDAAQLNGIHIESFQASAVGGFRVWGGRSWEMKGLLINGLPATASYLGLCYYTSQGEIRGHFEQNYGATAGGGTPGLHGFYCDGCNGMDISNSEFFNTHGDVTKAFIYFAGGKGNKAEGNSYRATRAASYDVIVKSDDTLVRGSIAKNTDDSARSVAVYLEPANSLSYATIFAHVPMVAEALAGLSPEFGPISAIGASGSTFTKTKGGTGNFHENSIKCVADEAGGGAAGNGASIGFYSDNTVGESCTVGRVGSIWEDPTDGFEVGGVGVWVRVDPTDTAAAQLAAQFLSSGVMKLLYGGIEIATAGKGIKMKNAAGTVTKTARLNAAGDGLEFV